MTKQQPFERLVGKKKNAGFLKNSYKRRMFGAIDGYTWLHAMSRTSAALYVHLVGPHQLIK